MKNPTSRSLSIGLLIGVVIGVFTDNLALYMSIGILLGAAYKYNFKNSTK